MAKQSTHNRSSGGSIPSGPTIESLRKQGKWPFPLWENGRIVPVKVRYPRVSKFDRIKDVEPAPF